MNDRPPPVAIKPARKSFFDRASIVWVIPLAALVVSLGVAWQAYDSRGPLIEIAFQNGAGIAAKKTELRYRDVTVGVVEGIEFAPDLAAVIVSVRLHKEIAPFVDVASNFWVVRPEVSASGVTGLDTVLSGVYIEGSWDSTISARGTKFKGLVDPPLSQQGKEGLEIAVRSTSGGSLTDNSPITFRGIEVGRIGKARISVEGSYAIAEAIIYDPHSQLITPSTRFWDTSGFTFSVGASGAKIDFSSLATLLGGGVTFDTFVSDGSPVASGTVFEVFTDKATARNNLFVGAEVETVEMRVVFEENISGLAVDAPVEINGLKIGKVQSVSGIIDAKTFGDNRVRLNAVLSIQPARLGLQGEASPKTALEFLSRRVQEGLRARLASTSILTGGLKIELLQVDNAPKAVMLTGEGIVPVIPATKSEITDAAGTVEGVLDRINKLPIEQLLHSAIDFLDSAEAVASDGNLREIPKEVSDTLIEVRNFVSSKDIQNIPVSLNAAIVRFETLLAEVEKEKLATQLVAAVDAAAAAANSVTESVKGVPALVAQIEAVAVRAEELPLEDLTIQLTRLTESADEFISSDATRALPQELGAALTEISTILNELREGGSVTNVNATLDSARQAADAVATSTKDLPALVDSIKRILNEASATIAGYNSGKVLSRDAQETLRDISKAAAAMTSLARMLERNPSALIRGR
ncbi:MULTISPECIES: intermembrane transport protein PqiB [Falsihalocynthiibacter]|uniref:PqiB family protein n=1 Tax=Falsihalocynthiibacter TaxID=2854182 RepID=UPI003003520B